MGEYIPDSRGDVVGKLVILAAVTWIGAEIAESAIKHLANRETREKRGLGR